MDKSRSLSCGDLGGWPVTVLSRIICIAKHWYIMHWIWLLLVKYLICPPSFRGTVKEQEKLLLGPDDNGNFSPVTVHTIHRNRTSCRVVRPGQAATLAIGDWDKSALRKVRERPRHDMILSVCYIQGISHQLCVCLFVCMYVPLRRVPA